MVSIYEKNRGKKSRDTAPLVLFPGSGSVSFLPGSGSVSNVVLDSDPDPYQNFSHTGSGSVSK